jgi:predicted acylesterase/phospholipase RssA
MTGNLEQLGQAGRSGGRVGLVLSGGGARGAYELGALSVLRRCLSGGGSVLGSSWARVSAR